MRGKDTKTFGTSNMIKHLRLSHPTEYDEVQQKAMANKEKEKGGKLHEQTSLQVTLDSFVQKVSSPFGFNHPVAKRIMQCVAEMIILDNQPFSMVDNTGFERLINLLEPRYKLPSHCYFAEVAIPGIYIQGSKR